MEEDQSLKRFSGELPEDESFYELFSDIRSLEFWRRPGWYLLERKYKTTGQRGEVPAQMKK